MSNLLVLCPHREEGPPPSENSVAVWGEGVAGALGQSIDERLLTQLTPTGVPVLTGIKELADGGQSSLALLKTDGTVWHWGGGTFGSAGDNTQTNKYVPHQIPLPEKAKALAYGGGGVVLLESGQVMTFGSAPACAVGGDVPRLSPTYAETAEGVFLKNVVLIASGHFTSMFVVEVAGKQEVLWAGVVESLGPHLFAEPEPTEGSTGWASSEKIVKLQIGSEFMGCQLANGELRLKGMNNLGQMGIGTIGAADKHWHAPLVKPGEPLIVKDFSISEYNVVALMPDGSVRCWGRNQRGQIGNGEVDPRNENPISTPTTPTGNPIVVEAHSSGSESSGGIAGDWFTICRKSNGTLIGWGGNSDGELALGHKRSSAVPVPIAVGISDFLEVAGKVSHIGALRGSAPTAAVSLTATPIPTTKDIRLQFTVPNGERTSQFKIQWRHVQNSFVTGKAEAFKHTTASVKLKPVAVITSGTANEYVVLNPAVAPAWTPHTNLMEFEIAALYPAVKPAPTVTHVSGSKWRIEWLEEEGPAVYDYATKTTHASPEPGWIVQWSKSGKNEFNDSFHTLEEAAPVTVGTTNTIEVEYASNNKLLPTTELEFFIEGSYPTLWGNRVVTAVPDEMGAEIPWLANPGALPVTKSPHTKPRSNVVVMTSAPSVTTSFSGQVTVTKGVQVGEQENEAKELVPIYEWKITAPDTLRPGGWAVAPGGKEPGWIVRWRETENEFWTNYNKQTKEYEAVANYSPEQAAGTVAYTITTYVAKSIAHSKFPPEVRVEGTRAGVGDVLTVTPAEWENAPTTTAYQWYHHLNPPPTGESPIEKLVGFTGATFQIRPIDTDFALAVLESPGNAAGKYEVFPGSHDLLGAPSHVTITG